MAQQRGYQIVEEFTDMIGWVSANCSAAAKVQRRKSLSSTTNSNAPVPEYSSSVSSFRLDVKDNVANSWHLPISPAKETAGTRSVLASK